MTLKELQQSIDDIYGTRDTARGIAGTFLWFVEEVGELAESIRTGDRDSQQEELADAVAWLVSVANLAGVDLENAVTAKYGRGCPRCKEKQCRCADPSRPLS